MRVLAITVTMALLAIVLVPAAMPQAVDEAKPQAVDPDVEMVPDCLVTVAEEANLPAQEPGVLTDLPAKEGMQVTAGQVLGEIDQTKVKMEFRVADAKLKAARVKASDDVNIRFATAAAAAAEAALQMNLEANRKVPGSVPKEKLNELKLERDKEILSIEKSKLDFSVAAQEAEVAQAEADAAQENIKRRQLRSPVDGVIVELHRHLGEWVQPPDKILRIVRMDRLWVEGYVPVSRRNRAQLNDRPVKIEISLAGDHRVPYEGKVVFVKPTTEAGDTFLVRAEIANQKDGNYWAISPGLKATMRIMLK